VKYDELLVWTLELLFEKTNNKILLLLYIIIYEIEIILPSI